MTRARKVRILMIAIVTVLLLSLLFRGQSEPSIEDGSTLIVEISGDYVEASGAPLFDMLFGERRRPFVALLSRLAMAERDDRIDTVVLRISGLGIGWGKAQELRDAIGRMRAAGRRVLAHLELGGLGGSRAYYVAVAAEEIHLAPGSSLPLVGLAAEYLHLGGLWAKLGIEIDVTRAGKYKSAVEAIAGDGMSEAAREMANSLLDSIFGQFVAGIAAGRDLSESEVRSAIDAGPVLAKELLELGLIDGVRDFHALVDEQDGPAVEPQVYARVDPTSLGWSPVARVALIYGSGNVVSGKRSIAPGGGTIFASRSVSDALLKAAKDPAVDAIILRIDSPGGSALASEEIWQAVRRAKKQGDKPIVASFSDVAASGGYYVATAADVIVSSGATLTGSIGVFALRPILGGLFEKLDIAVESITRGRHADLWLSTEPLSASAKARMQRLVLDTYELFTKRVADGRSLDPARVEQVAQGRVWTGEQALEAGLIDEIGGLHAAVARVRQALELAEDADVALQSYPEPPSLAEQLRALLQSRAALSYRLPLGQLPGPLHTLEAWLADLPWDVPLAIPPLVIDIR